MDLVDRHRPDLVLMDIRMPRMDGLATTEVLRRRLDPPQVLILTTFTTDGYILRAPAAGAVLYRLTESGLELEPVLKALGLWGLRFMAEERPDDAFRAQWLAYAPAWFTTDDEPDAPPVVIQLVASGESAVIELRNGRVHTRLGRATDPDLVLDGPPRAVLGLLSGLIDLERAGRLGMSATGRRDLLTRLCPVAQDRAHAEDDVLG